jgi:hypothetical protein
VSTTICARSSPVTCVRAAFRFSHMSIATPNAVASTMSLTSSTSPRGGWITRNMTRSAARATP